LKEMNKITIKVSPQTHQQLKKAQISLSHQKGKLLTLDETIQQLCKKTLQGG